MPGAYKTRPIGPGGLSPFGDDSASSLGPMLQAGIPNSRIGALPTYISAVYGLPPLKGLRAVGLYGAGGGGWG